MLHFKTSTGVLIAFLALTPLRASQTPDPRTELATTVSWMARIGSASSPSFSPDGTQVAFVSNLSGVPQVWTVATEGGWPRLVTPLEDQVGSVEWSPAADRLAFTVAPGGGMNVQVYLVRPDGADMRRITDGGKETNSLSGWSHDGRLLRFESNRRIPTSVDAYIYDAASGQARAVADTGGVGGLADVSRDGKHAVLERLKSRGDNNLHLLDLEHNTDVLLTPHIGLALFGGGEFSPDGRTIYLASNKDRDLMAMAQIRLDAAGKAGPIEVIAERRDAELQSFALTDDGTSAALVWNVAGRSELSFLNLATLQGTPGPTLPGDLLSSLAFSRDGRLLAMALSGSALPQDIWILDRARGAVRQLTFSPHAGVDLTLLIRPQLVRYKAHDGLELTAWLYRPGGSKSPGPVVLSFHGGPEGQERPGFSSTYQALLARGIAVLAPNVRGSSGFGKRFVNLDNGELRANGVRDIAASVDYLLQAGVADPKRLGIMGGSYGGYMVMAGLSEYPDRFAAGANLFGVVNFETFFAQTEPWMAAISTVEYGDPKTQRDMLRRLSPIHKVDRVAAPTIVLHGANDTNVPVVEAEQVVESLKRRNVPVEYVLFPDEGHGFRKTTNRIRSTVAIVAWFARYLDATRPPR